MHRLLIYCARVEGNAAYYRHLAQQTEKFTDWAGISAQAEIHGLGPLLYTHLQAAGVSPPPAVKRELQGLYLRHRYANQVRMQVLAEILAAYQAAGIQALVLKGAALAHLLYPQPGLRPMCDLDLLVKKAEARRAQQLLADLGFQAPLPPPGHRLPGKHLTVATRRIQGLLISVEIHHNLFNIGSPASMELDDLAASPLPFALEGLTAYTLPYEEMLWHLCQHLKLIAQPFRLIWLADIVGLAERFVTEIDWRRVERHYPLVLSTLSLFHFMTPLSERLQQPGARLKIGSAPQGIGVEFQGWPRTSIGQQRAGRKGYGRIIIDSFFPSEWWLRLYYGLGSTGPVGWYRWVRHPLHILGWVMQLLLERMGK